MSNANNLRQQASTNPKAAELTSTAVVVLNVIRVPEFRDWNAIVWLFQAGAHFELLLIALQTCKCLLVVEALRAAVIDETAELLLSFRHNLPASPHGAIMAAIQGRTATPERSQAQQLLLFEQLRNQRQSQLLC